MYEYKGTVSLGESEWNQAAGFRQFLLRIEKCGDFLWNREIPARTFFLRAKLSYSKPGLVLGPGGMSGKVLLAAQKWPIFPAPGGSSARFPYVWLDDFVHIVTDAIESQRSGIVDVFYPEFTSLVELARLVRSETGRPFMICRVPLGLLSFGLNFLQTILRLFSMRLPDAAASVLSLKANQKGQINCNFQLLPHPSITLHEMIARSVRGLQAQERLPSR